MLVLSPVGGLLADRLSRPRLLMMAQSVNGLTALTIGILVATGRDCRLAPGYQRHADRRHVRPERAGPATP